MPINPLGQAVGEPADHSRPPLLPTSESIQGQFCLLKKMSVKHADDLYRNVYGPASSDAQWTYLSLEKFSDRTGFESYFSTLTRSADPYFFAIIDKGWPDLKIRFEHWLAESHFDECGNQIAPLNDPAFATRKSND